MYYHILLRKVSETFLEEQCGILRLVSSPDSALGFWGSSLAMNAFSLNTFRRKNVTA